MSEIPSNVPFKVIFDGCDVAFWNIPLNKHYWVIEKDKPIPHSFFDLQDDINSLIEENEQLKERIQLLSPLLDLADAIIDLGDDEKAKAFWEKRNEEAEQKWEKILKGDVE